jgi:transcriptional regulator with GAF, ATPase, and Fis domain
MSNALQHQELIRLKDMLADDNRYLHRQLLDVAGSEVVGADFGLRQVMEMTHHVAPLESPVLLLGETGSGKEVIANAIHCSSPRNNGPFIKVNCGAIPDSLMDSELFGHEKGAFTGAVTTMRGRFERAEGGTLFLDEIGELPPQAQVRLLHVLQHRQIERVGGTRTIPVNIRILSATNRNLEEMVRDGLFREDLWFRINVFPIMIPPLRQRKEDIPALVHHFIEKKSLDMKFAVKPLLAPGAMDRLLGHHWPGNVRELQNIIERAMIQGQGAPLAFEELSGRVPEGERSRTKGKKQEVLKLDEVNSRHIQRVLGLAGWKIHGPGGAAELLGIHPNTLRKRMDRLGVPFRRRDRGKARDRNLKFS